MDSPGHVHERSNYYIKKPKGKREEASNISLKGESDA